MNRHADKPSDTESTSMANGSPKRQRKSRAASPSSDNRPEAAGLRKMQETANNSPQVARLRALRQLANQGQQVSQLRSLPDLANNSPQAKQASPFQALADATAPTPRQQKTAHGMAQLARAPEEDEDRIQAKPRQNRTGLPDNLKASIESLSGLSMDHVKVHYNSARPAQLNALAYAQGSDIHLAPGQDRHLPHEAWHIVQQAQGRVRPTRRMKDGVPLNDDAGLEREAEVMGGRARQMRGETPELDTHAGLIHPSKSASATMVNYLHQPIQREVDEDLKAGEDSYDGAYNYVRNAGESLEKYINQIRSLHSNENNFFRPYAKGMAKGFKAWSENFYNKTAAYLYEAEVAYRNTETSEKSYKLGLLGANTREQPDVIFLEGDTPQSAFESDQKEEAPKNPLRTAVEVKTSTSNNFGAVNKLVIEGLWQLKMRDRTNDYAKLVLYIDNLVSTWPIPLSTFKSIYNSDFYSVRPEDWERHLREQVEDSVTGEKFAYPLEIILTYKGGVNAKCPFPAWDLTNYAGPTTRSVKRGNDAVADPHAQPPDAQATAGKRKIRSLSS
jgi:hypothetical protein